MARALVQPGSQQVVALPGSPELAVSDGNGRIFVNIEDKALVAVIDAAKRGVIATWPLAPVRGADRDRSTGGAVALMAENSLQAWADLESAADLLKPNKAMLEACREAAAKLTHQSAI